MTRVPAGILIVTHNSAGHIGACLDAVNAMRGIQDSVLVIDNASSDDSAAIAASKPNVRVIQNEANAGFAGAVNQGFRLLENETRAVLLLNPDVILRTPIDDLSAACQRNGLAGGKLSAVDGTVQIGFSFRQFPTPASLFFESIGVNRLWPSNPVNRRYRCLDVDHEVAGEVDQPAGAMLMIRNDVWQRLGGFDEKFHPVWFEDVDFCRRASLVGIRAAYVPSVEGIHLGGHSVSQIPYRLRRQYWYGSLLRYSRTHFERSGRGLVAGGIAVGALGRAVGALVRFKGAALEQAETEWTIARTAVAYRPAVLEALLPKASGAVTRSGWGVVGSVGAADTLSRALNENLPSTKIRKER